MKRLIGFLFILTCSVTLLAQDRIDEKATSLIREYTTDPQYSTTLVDHLPASDTVPAPQEVLGYVIGHPGTLTYYKDIVRYFNALDEASARVKVFEAGRSHRGNMMIVVAVSDAETIENLKQNTDLLAQLADPRTTDETAMKEIIKKAKPAYLFTGGLHSPETGSPEMLMEMAYRLAVGESDMIRNIREKVITLMIPVLEMDGRNRMVDWYYRHTKQIEKYEDIPRSSPPYWGDYTFHDNNRDGIMLSQPLSKNLNNVFFDFYPQVTHDLHESVPLLYISTGTGPYYTSYNPIVKNEWQWLAFNEVTQMTRHGVPGVWTWGFYTGWYPGYGLWIGTNHNAIGRFYETFGNAGANTYERTISQTPGEGSTSEQWYRPSPPPDKTLWSLRNNTNLMQSACLIALDFTARNADTILENFWTKGRNAYEDGTAKPPHAWLIPPHQKDPLAAQRLLTVLKEHRVELHQLTEDWESGEDEYPEGTVVLRMDQPYRSLGKTLLEIQNWPKDSPTRPYDATAWTLGLMLGVETVKVEDPGILEAAMTSLDTSPFVGHSGESDAPRTLIPPQGNSMMAAFLELKGVDIQILDEEVTIGEEVFPAGTWVIEGHHEEIRRAQAKVGLVVHPLTDAELPATRKLTAPRIGMYTGWFSTQSAGWARWTLDELGVPWTWLTKDNLSQQNLSSEFDVIIVPDHGGRTDGKSFLRGSDDRHGPLAYDKTDEFQYLGSPMSSPDTTGGMGVEGLAAIEEFVQKGGVLITLGSGSSLVTDFGLVSGVDAQMSSSLNCPGTIVTGWIKDPANPITYGYEEYPAIYRSTFPLLNVSRHMRQYVVAQFGTKLPRDVENELNEEEKKAYDQRRKVKLWQSGLLKGETALDGSAAIIDAPVGKGRIVMFGFNPFYRWMSHGSFPFVYNAIMNWDK